MAVGERHLPSPAVPRSLGFLRRFVRRSAALVFSALSWSRTFDLTIRLDRAGRILLGSLLLHSAFGLMTSLELLSLLSAALFGVLREFLDIGADLEDGPGILRHSLKQFPGVVIDLGRHFLVRLNHDLLLRGIEERERRAASISSCDLHHNLLLKSIRQAHSRR
jgi:hypothetical protein